MQNFVTKRFVHLSSSEVFVVKLAAAKHGSAHAQSQIFASVFLLLINVLIGESYKILKAGIFLRLRLLNMTILPPVNAA